MEQVEIEYILNEIIGKVHLEAQIPIENMILIQRQILQEVNYGEKIVLAISDTVYTAYLREDFIGAGFEVADSDVMHIKYLDEILDTEQPDILCINDKRLNIDAGHEEKRELIILQKLRDIRFNRDIRIVVFTERENDDEFLAKLIYLGIYDIFNSRRIDIDNKVIPQLLQESDIKNVAEIVGASQAPQQTKLSEVPVDEEEEEVSSKLEKSGNSGTSSSSNKLFKTNKSVSLFQMRLPKHLL